jgi:hypothetical protein
VTAFWAAEARFDWYSYIQAKGAVRAIAGRRDEYSLVCPQCGKLKLAINVQRRRWRCFTCGDGGRDGASLVARVEQPPWHEGLIRVMEGHRAVIGRIDRLVTGLFETQDKAVFKPKVMTYPAGFRSLYMPLDGTVLAAGGQELAHAVRYASKRRLPAYAIEAMRLGVCTQGPMRGRMIFPAFDSGGRLIFFQGRAMWEPQASELRHIKTLSPRAEEGFAGPGDCLLNLQYVADHVDTERVLVVEGPIDTAHGWPDVVGSWGKKISPRQMELLVRAGIKAIDLCWDNDVLTQEQRDRGVINGYEAALKAAPLLSDLFEVRVVCLPLDRDPGDLDKHEIETYRAAAPRWGTGDRLMRLP